MTKVLDAMSLIWSLDSEALLGFPIVVEAI
jgi:hypothetical protein